MVLVFCENDKRRKDRTDLLVVDAIVSAAMIEALRREMNNTVIYESRRKQRAPDQCLYCD